MAHIEDRWKTKAGGVKKGPKTDLRWRARYVGPDHRERTRSFARKVDAENFLDSVRGDLVRGQWVDPALGRRTFSKYADEWLETKADVSPRTMQNIEGRLENYVRPFFGELPLAGIRPMHVRSFVSELVGQELAPSTVKATYLVAAQVLEAAAIDGLISRSPCVGIDLPRERRQQEMHFLNAEQVNDLAVAIDDRFRALVLTAAYGGLRAGELAALRVDRVNTLARTLDVVDSLSEAPGGISVGPTKTGRRRSILLPRFLAQLLGEHIGRYGSPEGWVFTSPEGGPLRHRNFYRRHFKPAVEAAGLPAGLRFHDLRHTCAALLIANGRHMEEVKDYLGHSSIRVTSDRYGHLFPKAREAMAEGLDATWKATAERGVR